MRLILFVCFYVVTSIGMNAAFDADSLLRVLDRTLDRSENYETLKEQRIKQLWRELGSRHLSMERRYGIYRQLYAEYESYDCDSARHYINLGVALAERAGRNDWLNYMRIKKARILSTSGLFVESLDQIRLIDKASLPVDQLAEYYKTVENAYLYLSEYTKDEEYSPRYLEIVRLYRDSALAFVDTASFSYRISVAQGLIQGRRIAAAIGMLQAFAPTLSDGTRDYAVLYSTLAYAYEQAGRERERECCLIISAIADIKGSVKENAALRQLAEILYERGDLKRANRYLKKSIADATFFNGRMRNMQSTRMLPVIDSAHQYHQERQYDRIRVLLAIISVLALAMCVSGYVVIRQNRKLSRARDRMEKINQELDTLNRELVEANYMQRETNASLRESNRIKDEYIGRFLELCSTYIAAMDSYRKMLNRKAAAGKLDDVVLQLKSKSFVDEAYAEFYENFDTAFLNIFPDFVGSINSLMPDDDGIALKPGERLNTELRIFALIRLGISDSSKIAGFLRCSVSTIYTYRSRIKNRSLYRDDFEHRVMAISSIG